MKLPDLLVRFLIWLAKRTPYEHIYSGGELYMERYWLLKPHRLPWPFQKYEFPISIRVHRILRSDADRHLHDHPWPFTTLILRGGYYEELPFRQAQHPRYDKVTELHWRSTGDIVRHRATDRHRIHIPPGGEAWTLFVMGRYEQKWGFYTEFGKVYWRTYLNDWRPEAGSEALA